MPWNATYEIVKYWLPLATFFGLLIKGAKVGGIKMSKWANTFLDNHMMHIQEAAEKASASVTELTEFHKTNVNLQETMITELKGLRGDFSTYSKEIMNTQHQISTGIEVLKDRD